MAFVPDYDNDVFVSYAHTDNEGEVAWVTNLDRLLQTELRQRLGTKDLRIWRDSSLDGNHPLTPEIMDAIRRSACLLIVMSPSYLASEWCANERNTFLGFAREALAAGRVFIVSYRETDKSAIPPEFGDLLGYQFWTKDPQANDVVRPLGLTDRNEPAFLNRVLTLSDKLSLKLKEIKSTRLGIRPVSPTPAECVYLARSTDDMEPREEELKGYLTQAGLNVLPETWYPEDNEQQFEAAMKADLHRCQLFVQLLGRYPGRRTRFAGGRRFSVVQYDIARAANKRVLQWRELTDDPSSVADEAHRGFLEGAQACGFEEFKRAVVDAAHIKPEAAKREAAQATASVFVNADRDDLGMARQLSELLAEEGVECYWPIVEGSPEKVRQDLEENLKSCNGLVLIYGSTEPSWVRDQLRQGRKVLGQRDRPLAALAVYLGPPSEKPELAVALPQLIMLDGRAGITRQSLQKFIAKLNSEA